jgi:hypothetical protein
MIDEKIKGRIVEMGGKTLDTIGQVFDGEAVEPVKVNLASKMLSQVVKVLQMNQVKINTERSQAIRLLPWLKNDKTRAEYIEATMPKAAPLMLSRPKKK